MNKGVKAKMAKKEEGMSYPSRFGSHSSMIDKEATKKIFDFEELNEVAEKEKEKKAKEAKEVFVPAYRSREVVLKDEHGLYITERSKLDNGLIDINRSNNISSRERVKEALKK